MIEHLFERVKAGSDACAGRVASLARAVVVTVRRGSVVVSRLTEVAVDCADPHALARFWCAALGYEVQEVDEAEGFVSVGPPAAAARPGAPTLGFARVPEPKVGKNRLHLDVRPEAGDRDAEVERLLALGATRAGGDEGLPWVVLLDPEGNEFCVLAGPADGQRPA